MFVLGREVGARPWAIGPRPSLPPPLTRGLLCTCQACSPLWSHECGSSYYTTGMCSRVNSNFRFSKTVAPALQSKWLPICRWAEPGAVWGGLGLWSLLSWLQSSIWTPVPPCPSPWDDLDRVTWLGLCGIIILVRPPLQCDGGSKRTKVVKTALASRAPHYKNPEDGRGCQAAMCRR